ncbi:MAG: hypothetical protein QW279_04165, partial [Candidatus Jordarchaeaceae archaeon]
MRADERIDGARDLAEAGAPDGVRPRLFTAEYRTLSYASGPLLFVEHGPVVYAFLIGFLVANALMMAIGLFAVR